MPKDPQLMKTALKERIRAVEDAMVSGSQKAHDELTNAGGDLPDLCRICLTNQIVVDLRKKVDIAGGTFEFTEACGHRCCSACAVKYFEYFIYNVRDRLTAKVACFDPQCSKQMSDAGLSAFLKAQN